MKINWRQKLTSRKFWAAIVSVILAVMAVFGIEDITQEQVVTLMMAIGGLIAYILGEGFVDSVRIKTEQKEEKD